MDSDCWTNFLNSQMADNDSTGHNVSMLPKFHSLSSRELNFIDPTTKRFYHKRLQCLQNSHKSFCYAWQNTATTTVHSCLTLSSM